MNEVKSKFKDGGEFLGEKYQRHVRNWRCIFKVNNAKASLEVDDEFWRSKACFQVQQC